MVDIKEKTLAILNPLGDENSLMRTTIMDHMLQVINHNINHNIHEGFLYELSNTYHPNRGQKNKLPREVKTLCLGLYGDVDFFHLKGIVENILKACELKILKLSRGILYIPSGRRAQLLCQDESLEYLEKFTRMLPKDMVSINGSIWVSLILRRLMNLAT